jgi:hypothetical protein
MHFICIGAADIASTVDGITVSKKILRAELHNLLYTVIYRSLWAEKFRGLP